MKQRKLSFFYIFLIMLPLWGIMLLQLVVRVKAIKDDYAVYYGIFTVLMLLLILISLFISKQLSSKNSRKSFGIKPRFNILFAICWFSMGLLMLFSDIVVFKKYWLFSLTILILFTALFIVWQRFSSENRDKLLSVLLYAIETGFFALSVYCFLFRPLPVSGIRYNGPFANPNVFGIFLIIVWCCLITRLDYIISTSASIPRAIFVSMEFGIAGYFMFETGARTAFVTVAFISLLWFIMRAIFARKSGKPLLKYILCSLLSFFVAFFISFFVLSNFPGLINHPVIYERDRDFPATSQIASTVANAKEPPATTDSAIEANVESAIDAVEEESSPVKRLFSSLKEGNLNVILNGRIDIYSDYIKHLNYKGHKLYGRKVKARGEYVVNAHNNVLQMAYSYGLLSAIPYILLCILGLIFAFRYYLTYHDRSKIAVFPLMIIISFCLSTMTELMILPFRSLFAFCFYICIGELMLTYCKKNK